MINYVLKKALIGILLIITVCIVVFSLIYMMPGDIVNTMYGAHVPEAKREAYRAQYGLDQPLYVQFFSWADKLLHGDLGNSIQSKLPISQSIKTRIPLTLKTCGAAMLIQALIGIPLGILLAYKKDSALDRCMMAVSSFMQAVPQYWLGVMLMLIFSVYLGWLPLSGYSTPLHYIMPVAAISMGGIANIMRITKAEVLDVYRQRYVLTAYAKGLKEREVIIRHVMRNSLIVVVVMMFMEIPWIISGSFIVEKIFGIPGMGSYMVEAIEKQDVTVVQACVLIIAVLVVVCNLVSDVLTGLLDPSIRSEITGDRQ